MTTRALRSIYQLKVSLLGSRPPIWRRLLVASTDNLEDVHIALQIVMGWANEHLHEFAKDGKRYGIPDEDFPSDVRDEIDYRLDQVLKKEKDKLNYVYDFGDGWEHEVVLEKILPFETGTVLPVCLEGGRSCPPEDVGGIPGYEMFLEAISDPSHPEHEELLEWVGGDFDPEHFDLAMTNDLLREYCDDLPLDLPLDQAGSEDIFEDLFSALMPGELELLDQFLLNRIDDDAVTEGKDEGIIDISTLDGFFTAIVSGPGVIQPSQWLPAVWGDFAPEWKSENEFETILSLMMRHMNDIAASLMEHPEDFEPLILEREVEGKTYAIVDEWCEGYWRGVSLAADQWELDGQEMRLLLAPITAFTRETNWRGHDLNEDEVENIQNTIAPNVRAIHAFWLARRSDNLTLEPVRRQEQKLGRNDPCPCGSGKKYKKCCLH